MVRSKDFYTEFEKEMETIEDLYSEEVTPSEAPQIANLQRQKVSIENKLRNKQLEQKRIQDEIVSIQQEIAKIDERIARFKTA